ncbi:hypothetical protein PHLCEN_2v1750, partial [Hermanssonia centrifuga]
PCPFPSSAHMPSSSHSTHPKMLPLLFLSLITFLLSPQTYASTPTPTPTAAAPIVDLGYAQYRGNRTYPNTVAYLGLPYAEPPVGDLRFRAPLPLDTARVQAELHQGGGGGALVVDASVYPDFCVQGTTGQGDAGGAGSEDCLKVNVYAPAGAKKGDDLPVLVYFHGGGYVYGNPANWPFDPWVHQMPSVVIVSVYYRLDSLGFLSHPAFTSSSVVGTHNAGFLDQVEALRWIQRNVGAFGGDAGRVTINGQSAGASSVELHLVAGAGGERLFGGAIAQSVYRTPLPTPEQQEPLFDFYAERAGCGGAGTVEVTMGCLRRASLSALAPAQDAAFNGSYNVFHPVLDGTIIPMNPSIAMREGKFQRVPVIVGATSNETLSGGTDLDSALHAFFPGLTAADLAAYDEQYRLSQFEDASQQVRVGTGESELRCAAEIIGGAVAGQGTGAWVYRYNTANPTSGSPIVEHAAENWMLFEGTNTGFNGSTRFSAMTAAEDAFASEMIAYFLSFVRTGDPNTYRLARSPEWPGYSVGGERRMVLQQGTETESGCFGESVCGDEQERCAFVATKAAAQQA